MKRIRAGLIVISAWSMALVVIAAAATVCSSCGAKAAPSRVSCQGR
jgi:hypothetical protein